MSKIKQYKRTLFIPEYPEYCFPGDGLFSRDYARKKHTYLVVAGSPQTAGSASKSRI